MLISYLWNRENPCYKLRGERPGLILLAIKSIHEERDQASSPAPPPDLKLTEIVARGLIAAFLIESIERNRGSTARLGYSQLNYGRLFVRDRWTLFALARELGCTIEELIEPPRPANDSRVVWSDLTECSEIVMSAARSLPEQLKKVTLLRATGMSWRRVYKVMPDRVPFSLAEDYERGIAKIQVLALRECRLLAFSDHPRLTRLKASWERK